MRSRRCRNGSPADHQQLPQVVTAAQQPRASRQHDPTASSINRTQIGPQIHEVSLDLIGNHYEALEAVLVGEDKFFMKEFVPARGDAHEPTYLEFPGPRGRLTPRAEAD